MPIESKPFRDAMARLGAAVNIVTTGGPAGRGGFTASAVCSVTDSPPTLLVCMNRSVSSAEAFRTNGVLCVNTLSSGQKDLSGVFAGFTGVDGEERFNHGAWGTLATGAPALSGALVSFDCRIVETLEKGTHLILLAEVEAVSAGAVGEQGLVWFARDYHAVGRAA